MRALQALVIVLTLLVTGCVGAPGLDVDVNVEDSRRESSHEFEGTVRTGAPQTFVFDVPEDTAEVEALLTWDGPGSRVEVRLLDPSGEEATRGWHEAPGRAYVTTTHPPEAGEWTAEVMTEGVTFTAFTLEVAVRSEAPPHGPIEKTFTVPARNPARDLPEGRGAVYPLFPRDFAEVNLNMVPGNGFTFTWEATEEVYFNVHYHGEDGTERPIEHTGKALNGTFTADMTEVYSLLWLNEGSEPVDVTVSMDGVYRLHSVTRDV